MLIHPSSTVGPHRTWLADDSKCSFRMSCASRGQPLDPVTSARAIAPDWPVELIVLGPVLTVQGLTVPTDVIKASEWQKGHEPDKGRANVETPRGVRFQKISLAPLVNRLHSNCGMQADRQKTVIPQALWGT